MNIIPSPSSFSLTNPRSGWDVGWLFVAPPLSSLCYVNLCVKPRAVEHKKGWHSMNSTKHCFIEYNMKTRKVQIRQTRNSKVYTWNSMRDIWTVFLRNYIGTWTFTMRDIWTVFLQNYIGTWTFTIILLYFPCTLYENRMNLMGIYHSSVRICGSYIRDWKQILGKLKNDKPSRR